MTNNQARTTNGPDPATDGETRGRVSICHQMTIRANLPWQGSRPLSKARSPRLGWLPRPSPERSRPCPAPVSCGRNWQIWAGSRSSGQTDP
jgi:hypothetical protein